MSPDLELLRRRLLVHVRRAVSPSNGFFTVGSGNGVRHLSSGPLGRFDISVVD